MTTLFFFLTTVGLAIAFPIAYINKSGSDEAPCKGLYFTVVNSSFAPDLGCLMHGENGHERAYDSCDSCVSECERNFCESIPHTTVAARRLQGTSAGSFALVTIMVK